MFILIFYTLPLAFVASDHNVINGEDWTKENEFLNELFQTLESSKTKNAANFIDNSFAYTEQSPIDWSRVMTQLTAPSEKYVQKMLELLANSTTTAHSNPIERDLFIDVMEIMMLSNVESDKYRIMEKYSEFFKYFIFIPNHSQPSFIDLKRKTGFRNKVNSTRVETQTHKSFCSMEQSSIYKYVYDYPNKNVEFLFNPLADQSSPSQRFQSIDYKCINAFGIASTITKSENSLFILGDGIQTVFAPNTYNVFLIGNDGKTIYGGSKDDIFIIYGNYSSGTIHGLGGHNVLDFSKIERQDGPPISIMAYPYDGADKLYITGLVFLEAFEIKEIIGRENQTDYVHASCQMQRIDLKGGEQYSADEIYLMDPYTIEQCKINLSIVLAGHTKIHGGAMNGKITYLIDGRQDTNTYLFSPCSSMNEILLHDVSLRNVNVNDSLNTIGIAFDAVSDADKIVKLSIETVRCPLDNTTLYFKDGFVKFTNRNQLLVFIKNLDYDIDDIIPRWRNLSSISTMVYMVGDEQVSRVFNGNQINYYDKDDALKSIQVFDSNWQSMKTSFCPVNSKVNYFDIDGVDNPNNLDIIIDCLDNSNQNHLWLTNFTKAMHRKGYREVYVELAYTSSPDLILNIFLVAEFEKSENIGKITIKDGKVNEVYQALDVQIYSHLTFVGNGDNLALRAKDQTINTTNERIIKITPDQFDRGTKFIFADSDITRSQLRSFFIAGSNDLVLANIDSNKPFFIILSDYQVEEAKYVTVKFGFTNKDGSIVDESFYDVRNEPYEISDMYKLFDKVYP